jgi:methylated-DNA-[protein]-cysteine S-methyltransferase
MTPYTYIDSPLGRILLTSDGGALSGLYFVGQKYAAVPAGDWAREPHAAPFAQAQTELAQYFASERKRFDLPLALTGTPFQVRVWQALRAISCGTTMSYTSLALSLGIPRSVRAVAAAVGRNPISVVIPCHRIIGSDGLLTGYAGGLERKRALLELECGSLCASVRAREAGLSKPQAVNSGALPQPRSQPPRT